MDTKNFVLSAVIAGALAGVLSVLPVVNLVNCVLCGWLWIGGIFAVWLYRYLSGDALPIGRAALLGLLVGVFCAFLSTILQALFRTPSAIPPETMSQLEQTLGPEAARIFTAQSTSIIVGLIFGIIFNGLFGALGGLIGGSIFKPKPGTTGPVM